eukprot:3636343-Rhodomonas_salina.1
MMLADGCYSLASKHVAAQAATCHRGQDARSAAWRAGGGGRGGRACGTCSLQAPPRSARPTRT